MDSIVGRLSSMLTPNSTDYCKLDREDRATLVVVIDTEEEFDWSGGHSRSNTSVRSTRRVERVQCVFDQYKITPTYVIDYPIVSQPDGYCPLLEVHRSGRCLIGAHLHPWVNPPFDEAVNRYNSFPGNLPRSLEASKLRILTDSIGERFGRRPTMYKAGRYGIGPNTAEILEEQGYEIDLSVCPLMNYSSEGGPDFTSNSPWPYWFGTRDLLELPLTVGFAGLLRRWGRPVHDAASRGLMASLHGPGILARLGLVNKIWLSPEGYLGKELIDLVRALYRDGLRVFSFAFHSPSLECGHTPYVRNQSDLEELFSRCQTFFDFFMGDLGGIPTTPLDLKQRLVRPDNINRE